MLRDHVSVSLHSPVCQRFQSKLAHLVPIKVHMSSFEAVATTAAKQNSLAVARSAVTSCLLCRCFSLHLAAATPWFCHDYRKRICYSNPWTKCEWKKICCWLARWMGKIFAEVKIQAAATVWSWQNHYRWLDLAFVQQFAEAKWPATASVCVACQQHQVAST